MVLITFSWDDGSAEDLRMSDLSAKYGIPGMFFIPASNPERKVMKPEEIKIVNSHFEVGAHTYSHKYLTQLPVHEAEQEIIRGKAFLEQLLGKNTAHFCFPGGRYNKVLAGIAQQHFISARTADTGALICEGSFLIRPALHFYDRGRLSLLYNSAKNKSLIFPAVLKNVSENKYFELIRKIISEVNMTDGTHRMIIWGHSWEIGQQSLWQQLEDFFRWISANYSSSLRTYSDILRANLRTLT